MSTLARIPLVCPYCKFKFEGFYIVRRIMDLIKGEQFHTGRCGWTEGNTRHGCGELFVFRRFWRKNPPPDVEYFCLGKADKMTI